MAKNNDNNHQRGRNQKLKGWGFTFFGDSSITPEQQEKSADIQSESGIKKFFPLAMASVGERLEVLTLKGTEGAVHRLIGMGFVSGSEIQIISTTNGSLIVALGNNRIGLGMGMAQKIICKSKI